MKKLIGLIAGVFLAAGIQAGQSTVSSYAAPKLVEEINTALANPTSATMTVTGNATVGGTLGVTSTISNGSLTASLPVFADASKKLVSGTTGLAVTNAEIATEIDCLDSVTPAFSPAWTNATAAVTVIGGDEVVTNIDSTTLDVVVTNATVGGAALSGVDLVITNVSVSFQTVELTTDAWTNTVVTNVTISLQTGTPAVSAPSITLQTASAVGSITEETGAITATSALTEQTGDFVDGITSNVVTAAKTISLETGTFAQSP